MTAPTHATATATTRPLRARRPTLLPHTALVCLALAVGALAQQPAFAQSTDAATAPGDGPTLLAAAASGGTPSCPALRFNMVQRRVLNEADRGPDQLRQYVQRTRMIHQLDLAETSNWVDQVRARNADCTVKIVAIAP